jgi:gluconate 5-dehydrogenase/2-deoxy-D-gluconate 3-dehydrogenase
LIFSNESRELMALSLGLENRRVFVAGAGGLGGACAAGFAGCGSRVVVADADGQRLRDLAGELDLAAALRADLSRAEDCRTVVEKAVATLGGLDVFVHAVGVNDRRPLLELGDDDWDRVLTINLSSAYWLGQAVGRVMRPQGSGRLVFVSSVAGVLGHAHHGPYAASKGGLNQLMRVMAREWAADGIGVNAVAPGYIETDLTRVYLDRPGMRDELTSLVPAGRLGTPAEAAGSVLFLASELSSFVTGQVLYVDGGRTLV